MAPLSQPSRARGDVSDSRYRHRALLFCCAVFLRPCRSFDIQPHVPRPHCRPDLFGRSARTAGVAPRGPSHTPCLVRPRNFLPTAFPAISRGRGHGIRSRRGTRLGSRNDVAAAEWRGSDGADDVEGGDTVRDDTAGDDADADAAVTDAGATDEARVADVSTAGSCRDDVAVTDTDADAEADATEEAEGATTVRDGVVRGPGATPDALAEEVTADATRADGAATDDGTTTSAAADGATKKKNKKKRSAAAATPTRPVFPPAYAAGGRIPTPLLRLLLPTSVLYQLAVVLVAYVLHLKVLTQHHFVFPVQLIPNSMGMFTSVGLDSLAGMASILALHLLHRRTSPAAVPALTSVPARASLPWKIPKRMRGDIPGVSVLLIAGYFLTGRVAPAIDDLLFLAAGLGVPMSVAMHRSLQVLLAHLAWVFYGVLVLGKNFPHFFRGGAARGKKVKKKAAVWYRSAARSNWVWWAVGGYFASCYLFNVADAVNQLVLPAAIFEAAEEGVVSQLVNPEGNDLVASAVGYLAPCLSAPWWEEVLYRGFMLPALACVLPFWGAVFASGVLFSIHHMNVTAFIPLAVLGMAWATIYAKSRNLLVTMVIHAMWNSRVFIGSWLGL